MIIIYLSIIGLLIAGYMMYAKHQKKKNPSYKAICDINDRVSCTEMFHSNFASIAGIPTIVLGIVMYIAIIIFELTSTRISTSILSGAGVIMSIYLAYGLIKERIVCIACICSYSITLAIFILSFLL